MRTRFGTDGMRGIAGEPPLDPATLYALGHALASLLKDQLGAVPRIALGQDTRESCDWIGACLAAGIDAAGGSLISIGVLPTPGLALVTRTGSFHAGLMVSASHNPYHDNGVKLFDRSGSKLPDAVELELERRLETITAPAAITTALPPLTPDPTPQQAYLDFLDRCREGIDFTGLTVVLDSSHGAAYQLGPAAFRRAGARVITLGDAPNGRNINDGCGSLHPEALLRAVVEQQADLGFAFDGDADRCIAASSSGKLLDGDFMLYYAGRALQRAGRLPGQTVVATVMSNLGLQHALERHGVKMLRAAVGDRYVLEEMKKGGFVLGGEQSGHVIFMDYAPTGDGVLSALTLTRLWKQGAGDLDEALAQIPHYPQILRNIKVKQKPKIEDHPVLAAAVAKAERELAGQGRVVVRYSGTEPKARVMIEGPDAHAVERLVNEVIDVFQREIGA